MQGALLQLVKEKTKAGTSSSQLQTLFSDLEYVADGGWKIPVRIKRPGVTAAKPMNLDPHAAAKDPFLPPFETHLHIDSWDSLRYPGRYTLLLNKFNVMNHHMLLVTRSFVSQFTSLDPADLVVALDIVREINGFGFYNAGLAAGPSQPHRHLQIIPREGNELAFLPLLDSAAESASSPAAPLILPELPYKHAFGQLAPAVDAPALFDLYKRCLIAADVPLPSAIEAEVLAHNVLLGPKWIMVVPRQQADFEEISGNGLNFGGSFFVKSRESLLKIERVGALNILRQMGYSNPKAAKV